MFGDKLRKDPHWQRMIVKRDSAKTARQKQKIADDMVKYANEKHKRENGYG